MGMELQRRWVRGGASAGACALLALGLALLPACSTPPSDYMTEAKPPTAEPVAGLATVYFLRPSGLGSGTHFQVWDRQRFLGVAQSKSYFISVLTPGKHLFIATADNPEKKVAVAADLAAGKRYYVHLAPTMMGWSSRVEMLPVTKGSDEWNEVETTVKELAYTVPREAEIRNWEASHKEEAASLVSFFETAPDRSDYLTQLAAADGR
jgi:hypothetical protein